MDSGSGSGLLDSPESGKDVVKNLINIDNNTTYEKDVDLKRSILERYFDAPNVDLSKIEGAKTIDSPMGVAVDWSMRCENDLAFFENKNGSITHVGILVSKDELIHASGYVRVDKLTVEGVFNVEEDRITHKLTCLRRLI